MIETKMPSLEEAKYALAIWLAKTFPNFSIEQQAHRIASIAPCNIREVNRDRKVKLLFQCKGIEKEANTLNQYIEAMKEPQLLFEREFILSHI